MSDTEKAECRAEGALSNFHIALREEMERLGRSDEYKNKFWTTLFCVGARHMLIFAIVVFLAVLAFIYYRLVKSNMTVSPTTERRLSTRDALRFALDNDIPIK